MKGDVLPAARFVAFNFRGLSDGPFQLQSIIVLTAVSGPLARATLCRGCVIRDSWVCGMQRDSEWLKVLVAARGRVDQPSHAQLPFDFTADARFTLPPK